MKLLYLIEVLMNIVFYIIISPVYVPYLLYKWRINIKWRRSAKVGDKCYFNNILDTKTRCTIEMVKKNKTEVMVKALGFSYSTQWIELSDLYPDT